MLPSAVLLGCVHASRRVPIARRDQESEATVLGKSVLGGALTPLDLPGLINSTVCLDSYIRFGRGPDPASPAGLALRRPKRHGTPSNAAALKPVIQTVERASLFKYDGWVLPSRSCVAC